MATTGPVLTEREKSVLKRLNKGMQVRDIADELGVSRNAVYQAVQRLRRRGALSADYTPTGVPPRQAPPGAALLAHLLGGTPHDHEAEAYLIREIQYTRDQLAAVVKRLTTILP